MDPRRFDSLTRSLAAPRTRRGLLGSAAALAAGLLGGRAADAQVTQAQCGNKICAANPGVCTNGCVCCVYSNGNSRCRPPGECGSGTVVSTTTTTTTAAPSLPLRAVCTSADQCDQSGGPTDCADNLCSGDGGPLNCCRQFGGACNVACDCCSDLLCLNGTCGNEE